jgi:hypothetical protein
MSFVIVTDREKEVRVFNEFSFFMSYKQALQEKYRICIPTSERMEALERMTKAYIESGWELKAVIKSKKPSIQYRTLLVKERN